MANALEPYLNDNDAESGMVRDADGVFRVVIPTDARPNRLEQRMAPDSTGDAQPPVDNPQSPLALIQALGQMIKNLGSKAPPIGGVVENLIGAPAAATQAWQDPTQPRQQLWPERMLRSGLTLPGEVASGAVSPWAMDPVTGETHTNPTMIERAQDTAGLMGGGALTERPGAASLGSGPVRKLPDNIVKHTDAEGYTSFIVPRQAGQKLVNEAPWAKGGGFEEKYEPRRAGQMYIQSPEGEIRKSGFWMGWPEKEWGVSQKQWDSMPIEDKLALEVKQQATAYKPLSEQFESHSAPHERSVDLFSDTQKPGAAIAGAAGPAPTFYSALEHATTGAPQATMSPQQWLGYLKNQPGVKAEELAWTGIGDWLGAQKGKVKKEDVQSYLNEHKVELKDVTKKGEEKDGYSNREYDAATDHALDVMSEEFNKLPKEEQAKWDGDIDAWLEEPGPRDRMSQLETDWLEENGEGGGGPNSPRYAQYQLTGGENYREHLLTLPDRASAPKGSFKDWVKTTYGKDASSYPADVLTGLREKFDMDDAWRSSNANNYRSSHWDEPNVLAHVRTNDRTMNEPVKVDIGDGETATAQKPVKSLHIEEIQSDWHQEGRKKGYKPDADAAKAKIQDLIKEASTLATTDPRYIEIYKELPTLSTEAHSAKVPDAPFKTTWPELALKRMIRHAAENGYDRISWTPGEAQAARYDLSKQIERLAYDPESTRLVGFAKGNRGNTAQIDKKVAPDKLADEIGKEAADKILNNPTSKGELPYYPGDYHHLANADLKVGGEGMREFYDKMLPKMAEKIGKAHGVKVKVGQLPGSAEVPRTPRQVYDILAEHDPKLKQQFPTIKDFVDYWNDATGHRRIELTNQAQLHGTTPVHYFDLPQSLRDHALGKGFPLYMSSIPFPLQPVDDNPWKKDK